MALGASPSELQARIMLQTLRLAGLGMLVGSVTSWVVARALGTLLFGVTFTDPATFAIMLVTLARLPAWQVTFRVCVFPGSIQWQLSAPVEPRP